MNEIQGLLDEDLWRDASIPMHLRGPFPVRRRLGRMQKPQEFSKILGQDVQGIGFHRPDPLIPAALVLAGQDPKKPQVASGRFAWRLISHLSLNYLSLRDRDESSGTGAEGLREILKLYADPNDRQTLKQIDGIRSVRYRPVVRRVEIPGPITFARGLEITVLFDARSLSTRCRSTRCSCL